MTAATPAQRKAAERSRKRAAGLAEVRGIFAPPAKHAEIRASVEQTAQNGALNRGSKP